MNTKLEKTLHSKGNVLLLHGLGDDLTHLDKLSENFKKEGYSVLRIDLHGHGETLKSDIKNGMVPPLLPYEDNVRDVSRIIQTLDFKNPILVGHSYGGAIAYAVANTLKNSLSYRPQSLILMAPYLRRLDHASLTGNPWIDAQTEYFTEQFMRQNYRQYFVSQKRKDIDLLVDSAIATTKGIRSFDILSYNKNAALDFSIPFLVIAGSKDSLVTKDQILTFHKKLDNENYQHEFVFLDGDHFFPNYQPKNTFNLINEFLNRP